MKWSIFVLLFFLPISGYTQQYWVYKVTGEIKVDNRFVGAKEVVKGNQEISIPQNSQISLFDNKREFLYHLSSTGIFKIKDLITEKKPTVKKLSVNYLNYVRNNLFGPNENLGIAAMAERGTNEDLQFLATLLHCLRVDRRSLGSGIYNNYLKLPSNYTLKCNFLNLTTNQIMSLEQDSYFNCYPLVTNYSDKDLYISIIVVSANGNIDLFFSKKDSLQIVPANSTIAFNNNYRYWEKYENEKVFLLGSEYPIDFSILVNNDNYSDSIEYQKIDYLFTLILIE